MKRFGRIATVGIAALGLVLANVVPGIAIEQPGLQWNSATSPDSSWKDVAYGAGRFVAVADDGSDRLMTSTNGVDWQTSGTSGFVTTNWTSVAFGNGRFVAVAFDASVITSTDGLAWSTSGITGNPGGIGWERITFGGGKFVAVGQQGMDSQRVMSSSNGLNWTAGTAAGDAVWHGVTYGDGHYVAVATSGSPQVMTSTDAVTWQAVDAAPSRPWWNITYGNGRFVAITPDAGSDSLRAMTSTNGIDWQLQTFDNTGVLALAYGNGLFVASGSNGVSTSPDGATWTNRSAAASNTWMSSTYQSGIFVTVGASGSGNRAMYSGQLTSTPAAISTIEPSHGPASGGTLITIVGSGFIPGLSVSIGNNPCTELTVVTSTTLTCRTPAGSAGTAAVAVTNLGQAAITHAAGFTYDSVQKSPQHPRPGAVRVPAHVKTHGDTRLSGPNPTTTSGTAISVSGSLLAKLTKRGDLRSFKIIKKNRSYYIRTYGTPIKVKIKWRAPGNAHELAYLKSRTYRVGQQW